MTMPSFMPMSGVEICITFTDLLVGLDRTPIPSILSLQPWDVSDPNSSIQ